MVGAASGASALGYAPPIRIDPSVAVISGWSRTAVVRQTRTTLMVGAASGASALGYAPKTVRRKIRRVCSP
jgi:hypothetical protein